MGAPLAGAVSRRCVTGCMLSLGVLLEYVAHVRLDLEILGFSISLTSLTAVISLTALTSVTAWTTLTVVIILTVLLSLPAVGVSWLS